MIAFDEIKRRTNKTLLKSFIAKTYHSDGSRMNYHAHAGNQEGTSRIMSNIDINLLFCEERISESAKGGCWT